MIDKGHPISALLGLDIGRLITRASLFYVSEGKYRLGDFNFVPTSLGHGLNLGTSTDAAIQGLQRKINTPGKSSTGGTPENALNQYVDGFALACSAGPRLKTSLLGLTLNGSLASGGALIDSLPLNLVGVFGLPALADERKVIDDLTQIRPEILIVTGGEDAGADEPMRRWIEIIRLVCRLLPESIQPVVIYAGNPRLESSIRRRIEPMTAVRILPNLQPTYGEMDLTPAQTVLDAEIMKEWKTKVPGLDDLLALPNNRAKTESFALDRMVRYLSRAKKRDESLSTQSGILAVDLGGWSTRLSAGLNGQTGTVTHYSLTGEVTQEDIEWVYQWTAAPVSREEVSQYLSMQSFHPTIVPETSVELALSSALARVKLQKASDHFSDHYHWFDYRRNKGLMSHFEPMIASGAVLTQAPTRGQAMLTLLDGLQPWGITTMVLDKHHILPILGVMGEFEPVLPIHVLESGAFENLGTVINPISGASKGETILVVHVTTDAGKDYSVEIEQGTLKRLVIPLGVTAELELEPDRQTDIGFGERGKSGRLKVVGGSLGVVIDARGRPIRLPEDDELRVADLQRWIWTLGD